MCTRAISSTSRIVEASRWHRCTVFLYSLRMNIQVFILLLGLESVRLSKHAGVV